MKKLILTFLLGSALSFAADVHFTWLLAINSIPGLPAPVDGLQYGAQIFIDSDNPKVNAFEITVVAQMPSGDIVTQTGTVTRDPKQSGPIYSTSYISWFGPDPSFQVLAINVKAVVGKNVTKPSPGRDYSSDTSQ